MSHSSMHWKGFIVECVFFLEDSYNLTIFCWYLKITKKKIHWCIDYIYNVNNIYSAYYNSFCVGDIAVI